MKTILSSILFLALIVSCEKDNTYMIYGKWVIESGQIYVEDKDNYRVPFQTYHYFGYSDSGNFISKSCLRGNDQPVYPFDIIIKDTTTWTFIDDKFIVNDIDTLRLILNGNQSMYNFENINGEMIYYDYSGKISDGYIPFTYELNDGCNKLNIQIYEMTNTPFLFINSKLTFKRVE